MTRLRLAELTSGVGALVLGVGLGALFPALLGHSAGLVTVVGLCLHAFGMWDKHRLEGGLEGPTPRWVLSLYWLCWMLLAAVAILLLFGD